MADIDADITGIDQLAGALQGFGDGLPAAVRREMTDQARLIVRGASSKVPRLTGAAAASLGAQEAPAGAEITAGGRTAPYYGFVDFGGNVGRHGATQRPYLPDGRYLYPAVKAGLADIVAAMERAVVNAGREAGVEVTDG